MDILYGVVKEKRPRQHAPASAVLEKIKQRAAETGMPYQRLMRDLMERGLEKMGK